MEVSGNLNPLVRSFLRSNLNVAGNMPHAQRQAKPNQKTYCKNRENLKPPTLIKTRQDCKCDGRNRSCPNIVSIRRHYLERILTGPKMRVESLSSGADVLPRTVEAV